MTGTAESARAATESAQKTIDDNNKRASAKKHAEKGWQDRQEYSLSEQMQDAKQDSKPQSDSDSELDLSRTDSNASVDTSLNTSRTSVGSTTNMPPITRGDSFDDKFELFLDGKGTISTAIAAKLAKKWETQPEITSPKSPVAPVTQETLEKQALELIQKALNNYNWSNEVDFSRKKDSYGYIPTNVSEMRGKKTLKEIIAQAQEAIKPSCFSCFCLFSKRKPNTFKFYETLAELTPSTLNERGLKQLEQNLLNTLRIEQGQNTQNTDWRKGKVLPKKK